MDLQASHVHGSRMSRRKRRLTAPSEKKTVDRVATPTRQLLSSLSEKPRTRTFIYGSYYNPYLEPDVIPEYSPFSGSSHEPCKPPYQALQTPDRGAQQPVQSGRSMEHVGRSCRPLCPFILTTSHTWRPRVVITRPQLYFNPIGQLYLSGFEVVTLDLQVHSSKLAWNGRRGPFRTTILCEGPSIGFGEGPRNFAGDLSKLCVTTINASGPRLRHGALATVCMYP